MTPSAQGITGPTPITADHDASAFLCGHDSLDRWLQKVALRSEGRTARTYVVCEGSRVIGYYCLATGSVAHLGAPRKLRQNAPDPVPVVLIGRLAVSKSHARRGIGSGLLRDALRRAVHVSLSIGCRAVLVHPIDAEAQSFYGRYGFLPFSREAEVMFMPIDSIAAAMGG